jgi:hypothetical protein
MVPKGHKLFWRICKPHGENSLRLPSCMFRNNVEYLAEVFSVVNNRQRWKRL